MNKKKHRTVTLFIVAVIALIIIIYIFPRVSDLFTSSYTLEYGELKLTDDAEACFVRDETVYVAGLSGQSNYYFDDNTLVRKFTAIMDFPESYTGEPDEKFTAITDRLGDNAVVTSDFVSQDGGILSYYADGYEAELNSSTLGKISYEKFEKIKAGSVVPLNRKNIVQGEPVFKLVNRGNWYLVCFVDAKSEKRFNEGYYADVEFEDYTLEGYISKVKKQGDKLRVIIEFNDFYENFARKRTDNIKITTFDGKGLIVNNESIAKKKKQEGVYVRNKKGEYDFVPVQVKLTDGSRSLVASEYYYDEKGQMTETVEIYDEILKKPKKN